MALLDTRHKRKSFAITTVLLILLGILLFLSGLKYMDPPIENGIAINFGIDPVGSGERKPTPAPAESIPTLPQEETPSEAQETPKEESQSTEDVLTQDNEESVVVPKEKKKEKEKTEKKSTEKPEPNTPPSEKPKEEKTKQKPKPSKAATDALSDILGASTTSEGTSHGGQGDDRQSGYKGDPNGSPYANSYYGSAGSGSGGKGWGLNGRSLVSSGKVAQECNESGKVVVQIEVDQNGRVVKAIPGVRGTTNNSPCLLEPAKKTAMMHQWNVDKNAPKRQVGFIEINFRLGE